jgi:hypothetical protein
MIDGTTTGWSGTSVVLLAGAATALGFLMGKKRGAKTNEKRWMKGIQRTAETGLPTGSDLNEAERSRLFAALKTVLPAGTFDRLDESQVVGAMREAAEKLLRKAQCYREVKPKATATEAVTAELAGA